MGRNAKLKAARRTPPRGFAQANPAYPDVYANLESRPGFAPDFGLFVYRAAGDVRFQIQVFDETISGGFYYAPSEGLCSWTFQPKLFSCSPGYFLSDRPHCLTIEWFIAKGLDKDLVHGIQYPLLIKALRKGASLKVDWKRRYKDRNDLMVVPCIWRPA